MNREVAFKKAFADQKSSLLTKIAKREKQIENLYNSNPEFKEVSDNLKKIGSAISFAVFEGDNDKLQRLQTESFRLKTMKEKMLEDADVKPIAYDCTLCKDKGYVEGNICQCIKNKVSSILLNDTADSLPIKDCTFNNFDLNFYSEKTVNGVSPRKRMTVIFKKLREYVIDFSSSKSKSMIFYGATGLGKTHLSLAVLNELLKKGYDVYYESSFNLFSKIETEHFNSKSNDTYNNAINCDLLIIDDLGSEFVSPFVLSVFYNIVNTRILANKPTLINTNLSINDIQVKYSPRISSRIIGEYEPFMLLGDDIRQLKLLNNSIVQEEKI